MTDVVRGQDLDHAALTAQVLSSKSEALQETSLRKVLLTHGVGDLPWDLVRAKADCPSCGALVGSKCRKSTVAMNHPHRRRLKAFLRHCLVPILAQVTEEQSAEVWLHLWKRNPSRFHLNQIVEGLLRRPSCLPRLGLDRSFAATALVQLVESRIAQAQQVSHE